MKFRVTNEQIILFVQNADSIIQQLSKKNIRNKYVAVLQRVHDEIQPIYKSIEKAQKALQEKYAAVNNNSDNKEFILTPAGAYTYSKDSAVNLAKGLDELYQSYRDVSLDIPYFHLSKDDLPKVDGELSITNQLVKVFTPFIISKELCDELLYGAFPTPLVEEDPDENNQIV